MKYMGSKNRLAKDILPIILKDRKEGQWYVEPFVGGFNLIDKVSGNRLASDKNSYLIKLFKAIQAGWIPPDYVSEVEYKAARESKKVTELNAFIGFGCSYSGKWFGGYARGNTSKGFPRNYCLESKRSILKQYKGIQGIEIKNFCYKDLLIPPNSIVYCDPPYRGTTKYKDSLNYEHFYNWLRNLSQQGHTVYISEYTMPEDFTCIYSKERVSSLTQDTGSKISVEKLFTL